SHATCHRVLHSFPTRRSSDLIEIIPHPAVDMLQIEHGYLTGATFAPVPFLLFAIVKFKRLRRRLSSALQPLHVLYRPLIALGVRSEEHTSELQSRENLVCRLL